MSKTIQNRLTTLISNISKDFELSKISKSPARFSNDKLTWFNREYIKMLSLEEFCHRGQKCINNTKYSDYNLRIGDYVYIVDIDQNKILINKSNDVLGGQDGDFYPIGGGRDEGETSMDAVIREVKEETAVNYELDKSKLILIDTIRFLSKVPFERDNTIFRGKEMNIWFYPMSTSEMSPFINPDVDTLQNREWEFAWHNLEEVIETNQYLTYPLWKEFCIQNNLKCFDANNNIKAKYKAWVLDKNRASLLNEFGIESKCVTDYITPDRELLTWKKITNQESLDNLSSLLITLKDTFDSLEESYSKIRHTDIEQYQTLLEELGNMWETTLKDFIKTHSLDAGSYFWPLRVALSGKSKSPSPFELLAILGKEESIKRIQLCIM